MDQSDVADTGVHPSKTLLGEEGSPGKEQRIHQMKEGGPEPAASCVSLRDDSSMKGPLDFKHGQRSTEQRTHQRPDDPEPESSCVSLKSDRSMREPLTLKHGQSTIESDPSACQHQADELGSTLMLLEEKINTFVKSQLKTVHRLLSPDCPVLEDEEVLDAQDKERMTSSREAFLKIILHFLRRMKQEELAERLQRRTRTAACRHKLKCNQQKKFQYVFEGIAKGGNPVPLNQIYTELYIIEGGAGELNEEHEVRQIEVASRKAARKETTIRREEIFQAPHERDGPIRTVLTKGVAGIGKTVLTQKFTLDWAEDKANQQIHFIFHFSFRELNVLKKKVSLVGLVHHFFVETKRAGVCNFEEFQVVFIFDGLDECRLPLDFRNNETLTDSTVPTSVDVLLTNLIKGNLLPAAQLWITTRPAAASQIPPACVSRVTEVRGFSNHQKEEYFRNRFRDEEEARTIISHIKTSRSLHIMCHIPIFCWITATVLEDVWSSKEGAHLPNTLTEMYIHFLVVQTKLNRVKYGGGAETDPHWSSESRMMIESLGKLAFEQLQKGNLIFYESDLHESGIDIKTASVCSGVFTQIFIEETGLYRDKVFCFVHLSVQEFLAALHVHWTFIYSSVNLLTGERPTWSSRLFRNNPELKDLYQSAVDEAMKSRNGHLDLFLRFLLGLSLQTNHNLLGGLFTQTRSSLETSQETSEFIKKKISESMSPERSINLFHCLNELKDRTLVEEIQKQLKLGHLSTDKLSRAQWSALVFILMSSDEDLDVFDLKKYSASDVALLRLLPVVKASNKALLADCTISDMSCTALASVLSSQSSSLIELDLSNSGLQDLGVRLLSGGLKTPDCHLKILRLRVCKLTERSCEALSSVLSSQSSSLRELELTNNELQDSGVRLLSVGLGSPHCHLETLSLSGCLITEGGCDFLASALSSNPSHLKELDLSYNHPGGSGMKRLLAGLEDPLWRLETLRTENSGAPMLKPGLRKYFCELALDTNTANRELQLSDNNRKVAHVRERQPYPDHPDRFDRWPQVLCATGLAGRCYWEVEWSGRVRIAVSYRGISRKGGSDCVFGWTQHSWSLFCSDESYSVWHNNIETKCTPPPRASNRAAVYVDVPAGTVSFYSVSSPGDTLMPLHTFHTTFTQPLHPGFAAFPGSVSLCELDEGGSPPPVDS